MKFTTTRILIALAFVYLAGAAVLNAQLVNPGGGGSGGAVTIADGADVAQGTTTDAACATDNGTCTDLALTKRTNQRLTTINTTLGTPLQAGGNVVVTSSALPSGASTSANQTTWQSATGAAVPANAIYNGVNVGGNIVGIVGDPCQTNAKNYQTISQTTNTQLFAGTSAKKTYVCHIIVVGADAENISLVSGTGSVCATSTAAVVGSTTAAAGLNLSANGGFSIGNGGYAVAVSAVNADNVCLFQSGSGRVSGVMSYVAQ